MNKVIMMGRLTKDPEIRYGQGGGNSVVGTFSIAVDRRFKRDGEPEADFFNCVTFGKTAEFLEKYVKKGTKVVIDGRLQNDSYTNQNGVKVTATKVIVETMEFAESKNASAQPQKQQEQQTDTDGFMEIPSEIEEELPFT